MSFFLFGPRQTGKTTLIQSTLPEDAFTVNLLMEERFLELAKNPSMFREEVEAWIQAGDEKQVLFVDEVQRLPALLNELQLLMDRHRNLQVILTGSSARKLKRKDVNLLGGRALSLALHPFTFKELGGTFDLEASLRFGTLPSLFSRLPDSAAVKRRSETEQRQILEAYVKLYLKEEIQQEALVRNIGSFSRFLEIAAFSSGDILSCSNVGRESSVSRKTVEGFYGILEDTLIGFKLHPWQRSARKRLTVHPKFYFFDLGVLNAVTRTLTSRFTPAQRGKLFETFLILETWRKASHTQSEAGLYYWRTNTGLEIDLLIEKHGKIRAAFEFKSGQGYQHPRAAPYKAFRADYPQVPFYVVGEMKRAMKRKDISVIPWQDYLKRLDRFL